MDAFITPSAARAMPHLLAATAVWLCFNVQAQAQYGRDRGRGGTEIGLSVLGGAGNNALTRTTEGNNDYVAFLPQSSEARTRNIGFKFTGRSRLGRYLYWGTGVRLFRITWQYPSMMRVGKDFIPRGEYSPELRGTYIQFPLEVGLDICLDQDEFIGFRLYAGANLNLMMGSRTDLYTVVNTSPSASENNLSNMNDPRVGYHVGFGFDIGRLMLDVFHHNNFDELATKGGVRKMGYAGYSYSSINGAIGVLLVK